MVEGRALVLHLGLASEVQHSRGAYAYYPLRPRKGRKLEKVGSWER
jgi:hypothetical protein